MVIWYGWLRCHQQNLPLNVQSWQVINWGNEHGLQNKQK